MIRIVILLLMGFLLYKGISFLLKEVFSETKTCSRCEGKGWWQNTRNRDRCEWCQGSGRVPKDFQGW